MLEKLISAKNLYAILGIEPYLIISSLVMVSWLFYRFFLKAVSEERHRNLKSRYNSILRHFILMSLFFASFQLLLDPAEGVYQHRITPYLALLSYLWALVVFVKTAGVSILQYLFLGSMGQGVPLLIVNIGSLLLSLVLSVLTANYIFGIQVGPLLATSAALSVILGLALQDTLGNLFAGISLQFDKTFEIGDWLEIKTGGPSTVGQVREISWRATVIVGWTDEIITIPNRTLASSQIANFFSGQHSFVRSQSFRLPYGTDIEAAKSAVLNATREISGVRPMPGPSSFISETTESWINLKLIYFINNYGAQYTIGDLVTNRCLTELRTVGIELASNRMKVEVQS